VRATFALDDDARRRLLEGLDEIAATLAHADEIATYEATRPTWLPSLRD
jgi:3-isopropylmalate/(R)-2-methylmalate dehydratase small subunit